METVIKIKETTEKENSMNKQKQRRMERDFVRSGYCKAVIRQITGRLHVSTELEDVIKTVISALQGGQATFDSWTPKTQELFMQAIKEQWDRDFILYAAVMSGKI
jgi:hypothetical protein